MGWQDLVVFAIVAAAVLFLVRRVMPRAQQPAQTFVPLDQLRKRNDDGTKSCH